MARIKAKELRSLSIDELTEKAAGFKKELFELRLQAKLSKLKDSSKLRYTRRDLAKVFTVRAEMESKKHG